MKYGQERPLEETFYQRLLYPTHAKRFVFFFAADALLAAASYLFSYCLRFEFSLPSIYREQFLVALPFFVGLKLAAFVISRFYRMTWRYVSLNDLWNIVNTVIIAEATTMFFILVSPDYLPGLFGFHLLTALKGFPRSVFLIDAVLSIIMIAGLRVSKRLYLEIVRKKGSQGQGLRTIIVGAGNTGEMLLRDMARRDFADFYPIGLLDDDPRKTGTYIHGVKVLGIAGLMKTVIAQHEISAVIIAIPSLNYRKLREIYGGAKEAGAATIKIVPRIYDFHKPDINLKSLEDIRIEDLIGRQVIEIDYEHIEEFLKDRIVLISGAGGSIGSEITMQVCAFHPAEVILFEIDETELHYMEHRLKKAYPELAGRIRLIVGDLRDRERIDEVFAAFRPQVVFHAAAYKHVPMMELNPAEAVKTNIIGTYNLAKAAVDHSAMKFVMISTDKAVRPTSVMGATKRVAEYLCTSLNSMGSTQFVSVRFGNVLGSRGSVLPLFLDQLKSGKLTITHPDMQRYFMTIPEAVSLVLQASVIGAGGEVLVLDMGEPVRVMDLAEELIRIHGLEPRKDIEIEIIGLRPGEKLFEEILTAEEGTVATKHKKVFIAKNSETFSAPEIDRMLSEFSNAVTAPADKSNERVRALLRTWVKHFDETVVP